MNAREKHQDFVGDVLPRQLSSSMRSRRLGFLWGNRSQPNYYESTPTQDDSMAFLYGLRCDFDEIDLEDILPMIK
jgi:hypothetical protein